MVNHIALMAFVLTSFLHCC